MRAAWNAARIRRWRRRHPFDRRNGVDTSGLIYADGLATGHEHDRHSAGYYATAPSLFRGAIERWRATLDGLPHRLEDYSLLDIGCGKGRVVLLASEFPFRRIVGVELNPQLAQAARRNLERWTRLGRACTEIRIERADALSVPVPEGPVAVYFFNSFEEEMVAGLLDRLEAAAAARNAPIDLIYVHPEFGHCADRRPGIELLLDTEIPFSAEDTAADVFGVGADRCAIYRIPGR